MTIKRIVVLSVFVLFSCHLPISASYPDSAEVLPKGRFGVGLDSKWYFPIDERYDPDGDTEDVAADLNGVLDSTVFPDLRLVEQAFEMPPGSANIGNSIVDFEFEWQELDFFYELGVTDRPTVGIDIPFWWNKTGVDEARLNTTNATVGKSAIGTGVGAPLVPLAGGGPFGDAVPLTTEDGQRLIGLGLDVDGDGTIDIAGYGYKPINSWSKNGFSYIEAGFRYQYFKTENWRLAFTGGVRFPTGEVDDPDNLVDYGFSTGTHTLLFISNNDYTRINNLVLNGTLRYELYLPDKQRLRVPDGVNHPLTVNKENVDRDRGDVIEIEASATYQFLKALSLSLLYEFGYAFEDDISRDRGFMYGSLEDETDWTSHIGKIILSYSTIPLYQAKRFPIPFTASISYRNRFAGPNNVLKSQYIRLGLMAYF